MLYLISYDLIKPEKDYPNLIDALKRKGAVRVLYSDWMLATDEGVEKVWNYVVKQGGLDADDRLLIVELRNYGMWDKLLATVETVKRLFQSARS